MQNYFFIWINGSYKKFRYADIIFIESQKNYVRITTVKGIYTILGTIKQVEDILPKNQFCRIHMSYIVSLENISCFNNTKVSLGSKQFPISEAYKKVLLSRVTSMKSITKFETKILRKDTNDFFKNMN